MTGRNSTTSRPQNSLGRRKHKLLIELGYRLVSHTGGGHFRYEDAAGNVYDVSGTSYDGTAWQSFVSEMRQRHPASDHPVLRRPKSSRPKPKRRRRTLPRVTFISTSATSKFVPEFARSAKSRHQYWRLRCCSCGRPINHEGIRPPASCHGCGSTELCEQEAA